MESMYHVLTSRIQSEDEATDMALQKRIKSLNWMMVQHLDIEVDMRNPMVRDLLDKAITEIIEMGSMSIPSEKLTTVVKCSKSICKFLQVCSVLSNVGFDLNITFLNQVANDRPISADQFLPGLVFVVIKANPPLLHSNIKFITRFANPRRLMSGESGYYFTNLCCATEFVQKLTGESLNIPEADFAKYIAGEALPPGAFEQSAYLCEAFRVMYSNVALLNDLTERQRKFESEVVELREKMFQFKEDVMRKLDPAIEKSKPRPLHYTVADDLDIKHIPTFLRSRILKERAERMALESVLVDVDEPSEVSPDGHDVDGDSEGQSKPLSTDMVTESDTLATDATKNNAKLFESSPEREHLPAPLLPEVLTPSPSPLPPV